MKLLTQAGILLGFFLMGDVLSRLMAPILVMPSAITGMLLFFLALTLGWVKEAWVKEVCDFLLGNIAFFFVPISVSIMAMEGLPLLPLLFVGILSTISTMMVTMGVTHLLTKGRRVS